MGMLNFRRATRPVVFYEFFMNLLGGFYGRLFESSCEEEVVHLTSEPISITKRRRNRLPQRIACTARFLMVWFFLALIRERRTRHVQGRLQVRVKATDWEPSQVEKINAERPEARVRAPTRCATGSPYKPRKILHSMLLLAEMGIDGWRIVFGGRLCTGASLCKTFFG